MARGKQQHHAEPARAVTDRWWDIYTAPTWRLPLEPNETGLLGSDRVSETGTGHPPPFYPDLCHLRHLIPCSVPHKIRNRPGPCGSPPGSSPSTSTVACGSPGPDGRTGGRSCCSSPGPSCSSGHSPIQDWRGGYEVPWLWAVQPCRRSWSARSSDTGTSWPRPGSAAPGEESADRKCQVAALVEMDPARTWVGLSHMNGDQRGGKEARESSHWSAA